MQPLDKLTRPLRDLVKESIFNLIQHSNQFNVSIKNSNILDLFAGSGSFGLECLSRGSKNVTFVENYSKAISILKKNGIIIMHRHKKDDDEIPNTLNKINERLYGISKIVILELSIN